MENNIPPTNFDDYDKINALASEASAFDNNYGFYDYGYDDYQDQKPINNQNNFQNQNNPIGDFGSKDDVLSKSDLETIEFFKTPDKYNKPQPQNNFENEVVDIDDVVDIDNIDNKQPKNVIDEPKQTVEVVNTPAETPAPEIIETQTPNPTQSVNEVVDIDEAVSPTPEVENTAVQDNPILETPEVPEVLEVETLEPAEPTPAENENSTVAEVTEVQNTDNVTAIIEALNENDKENDFGNIVVGEPIVVTADNADNESELELDNEFTNEVPEQLNTTTVSTENDIDFIDENSITADNTTADNEVHENTNDENVGVVRSLNMGEDTTPVLSAFNQQVMEMEVPPQDMLKEVIMIDEHGNTISMTDDDEIEETRNAWHNEYYGQPPTQEEALAMHKDIPLFQDEMDLTRDNDNTNDNTQHIIPTPNAIQYKDLTARPYSVFAENKDRAKERMKEKFKREAETGEYEVPHFVVNDEAWNTQTPDKWVSFAGHAYDTKDGRAYQDALDSAYKAYKMAYEAGDLDTPDNRQKFFDDLLSYEVRDEHGNLVGNARFADSDSVALQCEARHDIEKELAQAKTQELRSKYTDESKRYLHRVVEDTPEHRVTPELATTINFVLKAERIALGYALKKRNTKQIDDVFNIVKEYATGGMLEAVANHPDTNLSDLSEARNYNKNRNDIQQQLLENNIPILDWENVKSNDPKINQKEKDKLIKLFGENYKKENQKAMEIMAERAKASNPDLQQKAVVLMQERANRLETGKGHLDQQDFAFFKKYVNDNPDVIEYIRQHSQGDPELSALKKKGDLYHIQQDKKPHDKHLMLEDSWFSRGMPNPHDHWLDIAKQQSEHKGKEQSFKVQLQTALQDKRDYKHSIGEKVTLTDTAKVVSDVAVEKAQQLVQGALRVFKK